MGWIEAERQTRGDLEIGELVVSIELVRWLGRVKRADLCVEITVNGKVSLQKMSWCKQNLKNILTEGLLSMLGV